VEGSREEGIHMMGGEISFKTADCPRESTTKERREKGVEVPYIQLKWWGCVTVRVMCRRHVRPRKGVNLKPRDGCKPSHLLRMAKIESM
jgi:hypothetical protein